MLCPSHGYAHNSLERTIVQPNPNSRAELLNSLQLPMDRCLKVDLSRREPLDLTLNVATPIFVVKDFRLSILVNNALLKGATRFRFIRVTSNTQKEELQYKKGKPKPLWSPKQKKKTLQTPQFFILNWQNKKQKKTKKFLHESIS